MKRDIRDPTAIGEKLLSDAEIVREHYGEKIPMTEVWDLHVSKFVIENYAGMETSIEKYGKPNEIGPVYMKIRVK